MKTRKTLEPVIANAIIWAAIIIASSLLTGESGPGETMPLLLIAGWFATQGLVTETRRSRQAECAFIRRLLRRWPR